jgi:ABC-type branched-subunit amino acid transport system substrate-binding protein
MAGIRALSAAFGVVAAATLSTGLSSLTPDLAAASSGTGCIAIALPEVRGVPGNAIDAATGVRDLIVGYLTGPTATVVALEARLQSQAIEEAREKGCEPLLFLTVTHRSAGKGLTKAFGQAAGATSWRLPGGGTAATAAVRAAAAAGLQTASSLAASTKARDHLRLEYRLQSAAGQIEFGPKTEEQTATVDGEDLLTPVVSRAAEAIVTRSTASRF